MELLWIISHDLPHDRRRQIMNRVIGHDYPGMHPLMSLAAQVMSCQPCERKVRLLSRPLLLKTAHERLEHGSALELLTGLVNRPRDDLRDLAESLRQHVAELEYTARPTEGEFAEKVHMTASFGITEQHLDSADSFDNAFDRADRTLYLTPKPGCTQVVAG